MQGQPASQYKQAISAAQKIVEAVPGQVSFAGHSLGGGLATAQALVTGNKATIFNAAAVHPDTLKPYGVDFSRAAALIDAVYVDRDALTCLQDSSPGLATIAKFGTVGHLPTSCCSEALARTLETMPLVQATRQPLPAVNPPMQIERKLRWRDQSPPTTIFTNIDWHFTGNVIFSIGNYLDKLDSLCQRDNRRKTSSPR